MPFENKTRASPPFPRSKPGDFTLRFSTSTKNSVAYFLTLFGCLFAAALAIYLKKRGHRPAHLALAPNRFQTTFENAAIGLAHIATDGRFLLVNNELCHILGYTNAELLQRSSLDLTRPEIDEVALTMARTLLNEERSSYAIQKRYSHRLGHPIWVQFTLSLVNDAAGQPAYFIAAAKDITEQKQSDRRFQQTVDLLKHRERQLALLFEEGSIGDFIVDFQCNEVVAHPIVWKMHGYPDERGPKPPSWFEQLQHPDDRPAIQAHVAEAVSNPLAKIDIEYRVLQPDLSVRWLSCRGTVLRNAIGEPVGLHGLCFDISSRKLAEEGVRESEQRLSLLTDVMPQLVWFSDAAGNFQYCNQRWYDFTGQQKQEALYWPWQPLIHPQDLPQLLILWKDALAHVTPYEIECRLRAKDGSYRWYLARGLPFCDPAGNIIRWLGTCTDIEERKLIQSRLLSFNLELERSVASRTNDILAANTALTQALIRLQTILDSATEVGIVALDSTGVIQVFNRGAERLLKYNALDVVAHHTPHLYYAPHEISNHVTYLRSIVERPLQADEIFHIDNLPAKPYTREIQKLRSDGSPLMTHCSISPLLDNNGTRVGTLSIILDITQPKQLERQLTDLNLLLLKKTEDAENANRAKSEFLASMSHEIRTPMNAILGMADLLWESDLDARQRHYLEVFRRAGANLLTLVNDILDLSKIESGHFVLEQIDFDPHELITRTLDMTDPKAKAKNIALNAFLDPATPRALVGDPSRLQQILINLLGNAVKFTSSGSITLRITPDPDQPLRLRFEVSDTGVGIAADKLESIFEDFTQAETSTTRRFGGTGLGLGICRRLVNRMGGKLSVRSEYGKGSTFSFDALFTPSTAVASRQPEEISRLSGRRALIVDNNPTNRLIFAEMCRSWGMIVSEISDVSEIIAALPTGTLTQLDLIIVDRVMPGMDGFQLTSFLRKASITVPILMTTSDNVPGDETRGLQLGIAGYAVKPVRRSELLRLITRALRPVAPSEGATKRILIAEDSEDNRLLLEAYLENTPHQVTYVEDGEAALRLALTQTFDLILMDVQMPVMDGLAATRSIREAELQAGRPPVPVLALTANARIEDVETSRAAGCTAHVSKPISKASLLRAIQDYMLN
jgi:PAS domain S-box-containing protein